jgi:hypothetical protein
MIGVSTDGGDLQVETFVSTRRSLSSRLHAGRDKKDRSGVFGSESVPIGVGVFAQGLTWLTVNPIDS